MGQLAANSVALERAPGAYWPFPDISGLSAHAAPIRLPAGIQFSFGRSGVIGPSIH